jgi:hypothetical protein
MMFEMDGKYSCEFVGDVLELYRGQERKLSVNLVPEIDGKRIAVSRWCCLGNQYIGEAGDNSRIVVTVSGKSIQYRVDGNFGYVDRLTYFGNTLLDQVIFCRGFSNDRNNVMDPANSPFEMRVGASTNPVHQRDSMCEQTWHLTPQPRAFGLRLKGLRDEEFPWIGMSIPGALPVVCTVFKCKSVLFDITFEGYYAANNSGNLPAVYIVVDLEDGCSILKEHATISHVLGLIRRDKPYYEWWSRPILCTWGEQMQLHSAWDPNLTALNRENVHRWVELLENKMGANDFTIIIDVPWFTHYGDFRVNKRFGNERCMRELIDSLHEKGHRVLLWFCAYDVSLEADLARDMPFTLVKNRNEEPAISFCNLYIRDYSHPDTRRHVKEVIRYCLSGDQGCLNADGFKIDFNFNTPDPRETICYDLNWGVGDQLWYEVVKFLHTTAHAIKEDALLTFSGVDPFVQPFVDMLRLNDEFTEEVDAWMERARKGHLCLPETLVDSDGWYMLPRKARDYWIVSPVVSVPDVYSVSMFDGEIPMQEDDYNLLASVWEAYDNCPITPDMEVVVRPEEDEIYRLHSDGALKGFYSALCIGKKCLVTYSDEQICIAASKECVMEIPLPPDWDRIVISKHYHDGRIRGTKYLAKLNGSVVLVVSDSSREVKYLKITRE